jgi:hypothetical protein
MEPYTDYKDIGISVYVVPKVEIAGDDVEESITAYNIGNGWTWERAPEIIVEHSSTVAPRM